jgi:predicted lipoprotein with Yx(FWY)xxD motif
MRWNRVAAVALIVLSVGACGSGDDDEGAAATSEAPSSPEVQNAVLATADSDLGEIVVDGDGMTVYVFDRDTAGSGESACSDQCLDAWPPVVADSEDPAVDGVSGEIGTIERDDGTLQVTLDGLPLYLYAGDTEAGDVTGQAVNQVWWVVAADGTKITTVPTTAGSAY